MPRGVLHARLDRELTLGRRPGEPRPAHVSAASGIVALGSELAIVVDDEAELALFPRDGGPGRMVSLGFEPLPADHGARKKAKPDLEALCLVPAHEGAPHGALLALGSGSAPPRRRAVRWPLDAQGRLWGDPFHADLGPLYDALALVELNVEGAAVTDDALLLAQRGNGAGAVNAVITLDLHGVLERLGADLPFDADLVERLEEHYLPEVGGVTATFTDLAELPDGRILYSACGEDTDDPRVDGEFTGAIIGILGEPDPRVLDPSVKVEGLWPDVRDGRLELLLVADADDRAVPAPLLRAEL
jgi:hypothetical protein